MSTPTWLVVSIGTLLAGGVPAEAAAQTAGPGGRIVYEAPYFKSFSPASALEVVQRVPGFSLQSGNQEVRGFGQAAGNVVINGARPSSKSDTLETILARIPASRVARVEVGPGDLFGSEFSGKPQVLNLVLTAAGGLAGNLTATARRSYSGLVAPEGSASALLRRGPSSFNASIGYNNQHFNEEGTDRLTAFPSGDLIEFRRKVNDIQDRQGFVSGSWELANGENRGAHLNFRAALHRFDLGQQNDVFPANGTVRDDLLTQDYRRRDLEAGGDVTRPLWGGGLKLVGLATRRHRVNFDSSFTRVRSEVTGGYVQDLESQRDETVLRLVWSRQNLNGWNVETGTEGALNRLDSDATLFRVNAGGARTPIDLPIDQAIVTEYRGEAFLNAGRSLAPALRMDLGLTYERSHLTVRGDAKSERDLGFLKPKVAFDWRPGGGWHAQLSLARTVAQLNFEDFVSSAELFNDRINGGNSELVPQRAWEMLASLEHPILGDGLVKIEAGYNHISLLQDRVPTPEGFDAPGNLGTGRQAFLKGTFDASLARLGVKGGRLTVRGTLQDTSVEDPYTHRKRSFTGFADWALEAGFRQDLGKLAWGVNLVGLPQTSYYRRDELDRLNGQEPYVTAFAEYRATPRTTLIVGLDNAADVQAFRHRAFFVPSRSNPDPIFIERRERNKHVIPYLTVKHSFG